MTNEAEPQPVDAEGNLIPVPEPAAEAPLNAPETPEPSAAVEAAEAIVAAVAEPEPAPPEPILLHGEPYAGGAPDQRDDESDAEYVGRKNAEPPEAVPTEGGVPFPAGLTADEIRAFVGRDVLNGGLGRGVVFTDAPAVAPADDYPDDQAVFAQVKAAAAADPNYPAV